MALSRATRRQAPRSTFSESLSRNHQLTPEETFNYQKYTKIHHFYYPMHQSSPNITKIPSFSMVYVCSARIFATAPSAPKALLPATPIFYDSARSPTEIWPSNRLGSNNCTHCVFLHPFFPLATSMTCILIHEVDRAMMDMDVIELLEDRHVETMDTIWSN